MVLGKVIVSASTKGGTGKTTSMVNLAWCLSRKKKVVLIDLDLNKSATLCVSGIIEANGKDVTNILNGNKYSSSLYSDGNFSFIPSNDRIFLYDSEKSAINLKKSIDSLKSVYDYVLVDLHCNITGLSITALKSADLAIIPVSSSDPLALAGAMRQEKLIKEVAEGVKYKFLLCRHQARKTVSKQVVEYFSKEKKSTVIKTPARESVFAQKSSGLGLPCCLKYPKSTVAQDYKKISKEIERSV